jgi:hypothetical protein
LIAASAAACCASEWKKMTERYCVADVVALLVQRGRVVRLEEPLEQFAVADARRIERHLHDLGVARGAAAHVLVGRRLGGPARVAGNHVEHAVELFEHGFAAPEAAVAEGRNFLCPAGRTVG